MATKLEQLSGPSRCGWWRCQAEWLPDTCFAFRLRRILGRVATTVADLAGTPHGQVTLIATALVGHAAAVFSMTHRSRAAATTAKVPGRNTLGDAGQSPHRLEATRPAPDDATGVLPVILLLIG